MPYIYEIFPGNNQKIRKFLKENKDTLHQIFADKTGRPLKDIVVVPNPIRPEDMELASNMSQLEFVVDIELESPGDAEVDVYPSDFRLELLKRIPEIEKINFIVEMRVFIINGRVEHVPAKRHENCKAYCSIEHMQSRTGLCPSCGKP